MPTASPVVFVLGAGAGVGSSVAKAFAAKGYNVALASRKANPEEDTADKIHIPLDLGLPGSVADAFEKVKKSLGIPSVVVYNAYGGGFADLKDPVSYPLDSFTTDQTVNTISLYAAIQESIKGFAELPFNSSKTFIYTGNALNKIVIPPMLSLGVGKAASAHLIEYVSKAYILDGYKFYYADQRTADGAGAYFGLSGDAHGRHYVWLSEHPCQQIWLQTFTPESGYQRFEYAV